MKVITDACPFFVLFTFFLSFFKNIHFTYLFGCPGSLVAACELLVAAYGI